MNRASQEKHYLCINAGSSSLKLAVYQLGRDGRETRIMAATAREIARPQSGIEINGQFTPQTISNHRMALEQLLQILSPPLLDAVGHRIVHGGDHTHPEWITPVLRERLYELTPLAPLHMPPALSGIDAVTEVLPAIPQAACFDTAFHATLAEEARRFPFPERLYHQGVRRYGFHGLSYEYIVHTLGERAQGRLIVAHLGNGSSLAAIRDGHSVDTSMGLTPTGGVMMANRSGDLDPGVLLYLQREQGMDINALEHLLDHESGLFGVSGISSDMAELLSSDAESARRAIRMFAYQVRKMIGAYAAVLGGLDRLVFTGGIGEHAAPVRWTICRGLEYLGITLDVAANEANQPVISAPDTHCPVEVVATDEDAMIARHVSQLLEDLHVES